MVFRGLFFFFKQKTAYEMRISDWSSDVCSSDLFASILDLDIAIRVHDRQITAMEPAARQCFLRGLGVFQITLHGDIAAEHDFTHGLALGRYRLHGFRVHDRNIALKVVSEPLA